MEPPRPASAVELKGVLEAERRGVPFVLYRGQAGEQIILELSGTEDRLTIGRRSTNGVPIDWDGEVSRAHAELERLGAEWTISDDGLSRNGTFVNGTRISGRRRLRDRDAIRVGLTLLSFRVPREGGSSATYQGTHLPTVEDLTDTQRRILLALARPFVAGSGFATPATNQEIGAEVFLSVDAVKTHLRTLFHKFEIAHLPQNQKRARLAESALRWGLISERDL